VYFVRGSRCRPCCTNNRLSLLRLDCTEFRSVGTGPTPLCPTATSYNKLAGAWRARAFFKEIIIHLSRGYFLGRVLMLSFVQARVTDSPFSHAPILDNTRSTSCPCMSAKHPSTRGTYTSTHRDERRHREEVRRMVVRGGGGGRGGSSPAERRQIFDYLLSVKKLRGGEKRI